MHLLESRSYGPMYAVLYHGYSTLLCGWATYMIMADIYTTYRQTYITCMGMILSALATCPNDFNYIKLIPPLFIFKATCSMFGTSAI